MSVVLAALLLQASLPTSSGADPLSIQALRVTEPIRIDGVLDEPAWPTPRPPPDSGKGNPGRVSPRPRTPRSVSSTTRIRSTSG